MTTLTLHVEDKSILPSLKKVLGAMNGITIAKPAAVRKKKTEIELALEDVEAGRIVTCRDKEDFFKKLGF